MPGSTASPTSAAPAPRRWLGRLLRATLYTAAALAVLTLAWLAFDDAITVDLQADGPILTTDTPAAGACRLPAHPATTNARPADLLEDI